MSKIDDKYAELGGASSFLGSPCHEEMTCPDGVGRFRTYKNPSGMLSSIHWHPNTGAFETHGGIRQRWKRLGWENGFLGYPVSDEEDYTIDDFIIGVLGDPYMEENPPMRVLGRRNLFQGGCIVWWSDPEMRSPRGEFSVLLRPDSLGNWRSVWFDPAEGFLVKVVDLVTGGFGRELRWIDHLKMKDSSAVRLQDIPSSYGRDVWRELKGPERAAKQR